MKKTASSDDLIPEEFSRPPSLVSDDETLLPASLDFKDLHNGTITRLDSPEDLLIDLECVFGRFLEENGIGNSPDVGPSAKYLGRSERRKEEIRCD